MFNSNATMQFLLGKRPRILQSALDAPVASAASMTAIDECILASDLAREQDVPVAVSAASSAAEFPVCTGDSLSTDMRSMKKPRLGAVPVDSIVRDKRLSMFLNLAEMDSRASLVGRQLLMCDTFLQKQNIVKYCMWSKATNTLTTRSSPLAWLLAQLEKTELPWPSSEHSANFCGEAYGSIRLS
jgi:hypothetical protein